MSSGDRMFSQEELLLIKKGAFSSQDYLGDFDLSHALNELGGVAEKIYWLMQYPDQRVLQPKIDVLLNRK